MRFFRSDGDGDEGARDKNFHSKKRRRRRKKKKKNKLLRSNERRRRRRRRYFTLNLAEVFCRY